MHVVGPGGLAREAPADVRVAARADGSALEAKRPARDRVIDAGMERVTRRAPDGADDRAPLVQEADAGREERKDIHEIRRAVDRIDRPHELVPRAGLGQHLLAQDAVARKQLLQPRPDHGLAALVDLRDRIAMERRPMLARLVPHLEQASERVLDLGTREPRQIDRGPFQGGEPVGGKAGGHRLSPGRTTRMRCGSASISTRLPSQSRLLSSSRSG